MGNVCDCVKGEDSRPVNSEESGKDAKTSSEAEQNGPAENAATKDVRESSKAAAKPQENTAEVELEVASPNRDASSSVEKNESVKNEPAETAVASDEHVPESSPENAGSIKVEEDNPVKEQEAGVTNERESSAQAEEEKKILFEDKSEGSPVEAVAEEEVHGALSEGVQVVLDTPLQAVPVEDKLPEEDSQEDLSKPEIEAAPESSPVAPEELLVPETPLQSVPVETGGDILSETLPEVETEETTSLKDVSNEPALKIEQGEFTAEIEAQGDLTHSAASLEDEVVDEKANFPEETPAAIPDLEETVEASLLPSSVPGEDQLPEAATYIPADEKPSSPHLQSEELPVYSEPESIEVPSSYLPVEISPEVKDVPPSSPTDAAFLPLAESQGEVTLTKEVLGAFDPKESSLLEEVQKYVEEMVSGSVAEVEEKMVEVPKEDDLKSGEMEEETSHTEEELSQSENTTAEVVEQDQLEETQGDDKFEMEVAQEAAEQSHTNEDQEAAEQSLTNEDHYPADVAIIEEDVEAKEDSSSLLESMPQGWKLETDETIAEAEPSAVEETSSKTAPEEAALESGPERSQSPKDNEESLEAMSESAVENPEELQHTEQVADEGEIVRPESPLGKTDIVEEPFNPEESTATVELSEESTTPVDSLISLIPSETMQEGEMED